MQPSDRIRKHARLSMSRPQYCGVISLCYGSLNVSIGLDEASCSGRGSSPVDIPSALSCLGRGAFSAAAFTGNDGDYLKYAQCRVGGMVCSFSSIRCVLSRFTGSVGASDLISYGSPVNIIKVWLPIILLCSEVWKQHPIGCQYYCGYYFSLLRIN